MKNIEKNRVRNNFELTKLDVTGTMYGNGKMLSDKFKTIAYFSNVARK